MARPLTDAINALTRYANETTGQSDTTLSDAVRTLCDGYGGGGGASFPLAHVYEVTPTEDLAEITFTDDYGSYAPNMFSFIAEGEILRPTGSVLSVLSFSIAGISGRSSTTSLSAGTNQHTDTINSSGVTDWWGSTTKVEATTTSVIFKNYRTDHQFRFLKGQKYKFLVVENGDTFW